MVLLGAQRLLEVPPPRVEALLGRRLEAQEGQFLGRQLLRAERRRLQGLPPDTAVEFSPDSQSPPRGPKRSCLAAGRRAGLRPNSLIL